MEEASILMSGPGARSQSLYRKYRPATFHERELVGQEHVSRTLRNAVRFDRVAHAYLFYGPRGCGKTTTARLLAKAVNCLDPDPANRPCNACTACGAINDGRAVDIIEIDAASNRGIDAMRDLREKVKFSPAQLQTKFYIIDEVHQLTIDAANALLKTLEEPPAHAKFILATTDPEKVPETISSRCQTFTFRRIPLDRMVARLRDVAAFERIEVDDDALNLIARAATGSLRDALGLLDQLSAFVTGPITAVEVRQLLGAGREQEVLALIDAIVANDVGAGLRAIDATIERGSEARQFTAQVVTYLRDLLLVHATKASMAGVEKAHLTGLTLAEVAGLLKRFSQVDHAIKRGVYGQLPLELCLVESILARTAPRPGTEAGRARDLAAPADRREVGELAAPTPARHEPTAPAARQITRPPGARAAIPPAADDDADHQLDPASGTRVAPARETGAAVASLASTAGTPTAEKEDAVADSVFLAQLREEWSRIRLLVKAVDRKLAAFMASSDLAELQGTDLRITAESEFHVTMLNQDGNKRIVETVLLETYGRELHVTFVQRSRPGEQRTEPGGGGTSVRPTRRGAAPDVAAATPDRPSAGGTPAKVRRETHPSTVASTRDVGVSDSASFPPRTVRERREDDPPQASAGPVSTEQEERYINALRNMFNAVEIEA